jgi:prepilin signal peptidase PulO-like enzyme (type II secretory pathway)
MVSTGANWYGLVVYGIYTLGLGISFGFLRIKESSPIMYLSVSASIFAVSFLVMELIRFFGNQKEQNEKPAVQPLNILLRSIAGLLGIIFLIVGGLFISFPDLFSQKIMILIANTLFYCVIIFGLFYGSLVNSI